MQQTLTQKSNALHGRVICLALSAEFKDLAGKSTLPVLTFDSYLEYSQKGPEAGCFVIGTRNPHKSASLLRDLRAEPVVGLKPMFLMQSLGDPSDRLCDGVVASIEEACEKAARIADLLLDLDMNSAHDPRNPTYRLLGFLYSRPDYVMEPCGIWRNEKFYSYPIADAMLGKGADNAVLAGLVQRKLLSPLHLVDRLRLCPACDGAHLNYIDTCPNCAAIDIAQIPFLHCFACGHVGPEEGFLAQNVLACPKCAARLRHIGADYDRPLENFQCNACAHVFIDPLVTARCMHCDKTSAPEELVPRPIYALKLTEKGRLSARTGDVEDVFTLLDNLNNVQLPYYESILDWLLSLCRRHSDEQFSLIVLRIRNIIELTDRIGRLRVREMMDEFARRLRELIRSTDLTTRTNQHTFWLLLPKTDAAGKQIVMNRILGLGSSGDGLDLVATSYHAPSEMTDGEKAKLLMARLEGEIVE